MRAAASSAAAAAAPAPKVHFPPPVPGPDVALSIVGSKEPPIRKRVGKGTMTTYVLKNGAHYGVKIKNNGSVQVSAGLFIDGKKMGSWQFEPGVNYEPIERPADVAKKFTFYTIRAVRAAESAVSAYAKKIQSSEPATAGEHPMCGCLNTQCGCRSGCGLVRSPTHNHT